DYADQANWLCWPGRDDACAADLTATVVEADGATQIEKFQADPDAPIDCFYVYPTVSRDPGMVSSMKVEPEERNVVIQQAARLRASCRLYAPMYRQSTLAALAYGMTRPRQKAPASPYVGANDVQAAWSYYLVHENHGRGVALVGHSQGAIVLAGLLATEIYGKPAQAQLISAILMGAPLAVEAGKDTGGDLKALKLCTSSSQLGCVINYSSFRETSPPPDNSFFARPWGPPRPGLEAACTNPANLSGSWGEAKAYFGTSVLQPNAPGWPWLKGKKIETPFVSLPGLITAECVRSGQFHFLAIRLHPKEGSPRANDIPGDIVVGVTVLKDWGLHLIDANLFMGNLVDIVHDEGQAWVKKGQ
ncbi:MAG TPA: DUF3089 domain-containing protein, partial [Caulobacteraceae bacterium]|nr:DUF3089 domain-containing protein [Caulobacteraceae bacterium]